MKKKLAIALALGLSISARLHLAQNPAPANPTNQAALPVPVASPLPSSVLPEIHIQDAPLDDLLRFLASQTDLKVELDPRLTNAPPQLSLNLTNVTAQQALDLVLKEQKLVLIPQPGSNLALIAPLPETTPAQPPPVATKPPPVVTPVVTNVPPTVRRVATNVPPALAGAANAPAEAVIDTLTIGEMPVLDVVTMLAEAAKIDIIIDPKLLPGGTNAVSTNALPAVKFYNKTYRQALEAVLNNNDLVMTMDPKTQIARVTRRPPPELEPLVTQVVQLRYSNVTNMVSIIKETLPANSRTHVTEDGRTSQLVINATARDIDAITNLIAQLDTPTRQVLIEARLLETAVDPHSVKGINWAGTLAGQNFSFGNGVTSGRTATSIPGESTPTTLPSGRQLSSQAGLTKRTDLTTLLGQGGLSFDTARGLFPETAFLNADGVRAVLSFLNTENDTRILDEPRAVVTDNETAKLSVTLAFPIFQVTPGTAQTPAGGQVTYTNVGTILNVTPHIAADSNITLKVVPEVSNIERKDTQILNGQENSANVYAVRRAETTVTVPSGNTLVLGGFMSDNTTKAYTKVPVLGDIPGFGLLFRHQDKERRRQNLLIFVTPTIVRSDDFQPTVTPFLKQKPEPEPAFDESFWNRGKPKNWSGKNEK